MKHHVDLEAYKAVDELLTKVKKKVREEASGYYKKLSVLFNDLLETFDLNKTALDSIVEANNRGFAEELVSIHEIKEVLEQEVERLNLDGFMNMFINHLLDNEDKWLGGDYNKVAKLVNNFIVEKVFNNFAEKTMTSYLQMKDGAVIKQKEYYDFIKKLVSKSSSMFPINSAVASKLGGLGKVAFVSVPDTSSPIISAAKNHQNIDALYGVKPSGLQDRIYVMNCILGIPLCACRPIEHLENEYFESSVYTLGLHLYEGKECDEFGLKDWRRLAPLTPISLITDNRLNSMFGLKEQIKTTEKLFALAINYGIISDTDWKIYSYSKDTKQKIHEFLKEIKLLMLEVHDAVDVEFSGIKDKISMLEDILKNGLARTGDFLPFDGNDFGIKERRYSMMFDHFICAPTYVTKVKETVELRECIEDIYKHLNKVVNDCDMLFE